LRCREYQGANMKNVLSGDDIDISKWLLIAYLDKKKIIFSLDHENGKVDKS
jgi:hypothetical protein